MDEVESFPLVSRRELVGLGIASGVALVAGATTEAVAKAPWEREFWATDLGPEYNAAFQFAIKNNFKSGPGFWAVAYPEDNFAGDPVLIGKPVLMPKPATGTMPGGWGAKAGSIVVGSGVVLRLVHTVNGQDTHVTLLPCESMAQVAGLGIADGQPTWKLYPAGDLRPPY